MRVRTLNTPIFTFGCHKIARNSHSSMRWQHHSFIFAVTQSKCSFLPVFDVRNNGCDETKANMTYTHTTQFHLLQTAYKRCLSFGTIYNCVVHRYRTFYVVGVRCFGNCIAPGRIHSYECLNYVKFFLCFRSIQYLIFVFFLE